MTIGGGAGGPEDRSRTRYCPGAVTDQDAIRRLGDEGVLAMVCDSTNVFVDGHAGSEAEVRDTLIPLIGTMKGKVAVACFASNVARMDSIARAAEAGIPAASASPAVRCTGCRRPPSRWA